jgi:hypothetical protein
LQLCLSAGDPCLAVEQFEQDGVALLETEGVADLGWNDNTATV